jgi:hypothetical protein
MTFRWNRGRPTNLTTSHIKNEENLSDSSDGSNLDLGELFHGTRDLTNFCRFHLRGSIYDNLGKDVNFEMSSKKK